MLIIPENMNPQSPCIETQWSFVKFVKILKNWPPGGARPFVYFSYRPQFQHVPPLFQRFSLCEVKKLLKNYNLRDFHNVMFFRSVLNE